LEPNLPPKVEVMGLGLGIIKNIIENYKGTIIFESEFGKGTTFIVSLPIINSLKYYELRKYFHTTENIATVTINRPTKLNALNGQPFLI
jgi:chemotaxis protein histidine kinase CheA